VDESVDLPCTAAQVATARRFVTGLLEDSPRRDEAELLVSELAGNAVKYSPSQFGGKFTVRLQRKSGWTRIEVISFGTGHWELEIAETDDDSAESGRGLGIAFLIADRMGHTFDGEHDTVWVEFDEPTSPPD